jgi:hypothetical protein
VDETKFPSAGRTVRCAKCGHSWHQPGPEPEAAPAPEPAPEALPPEPAAQAAPAAMAEDAPAVAMGTRAYAPAAQLPPDRDRGQLMQTLAVAAGWTSLVAIVLFIGYSAVRYRQDIASIWPQSAGVYSSLGLKVNVSGVGFTEVAYRRETQDGQGVLVVTGIIVNTAARELPVPQAVRVTLADADGRELYHWTFKPVAETLAPGARVPFRTSLSSPPAAARAATVAFSRDGS